MEKKEEIPSITLLREKRSKKKTKGLGMRNIIMSWDGKRRQVKAFVCSFVCVCVCVGLRRKKKLKVIVCVWVEENQTTRKEEELRAKKKATGEGVCQGPLFYFENKKR